MSVSRPRKLYHYSVHRDLRRESHEHTEATGTVDALSSSDALERVAVEQGLLPPTDHFHHWGSGGMQVGTNAAGHRVTILVVEGTCSTDPVDRP